MNILDVLKKKYEKQKSRQMPELGNKKQYNVNISPRIVQKISKLSAEYSVPRYAIAEHLLETGCFYAFKILESRKKREMLREHIIDIHMLDSDYDDSEEILRLGEGRYASTLLALARGVVRDFRIFERSVSEAKRKHTIDDAEKSKYQLLRSVVNLAMWLARHPLEEPDSEEIEEN